MPRLTLLQRKFVIESMLEVQSYKRCIDELKKKFSKPVTKTSIVKIMVKWNQSAVIEDQHRGKSGRPKNRATDDVATVSDIVSAAEGRKSIRKVSSISGFSRCKVHRIIREELHLKPYKPTVTQQLSKEQMDRRWQFSKRMLKALDRNEIDVEKIIFSDESHIYLDDAPNKQNDRNWQASKPEFNFEKPLHSRKVTVWVGLTASRIVGIFFFEDPETGENQTVNSDRYVAMLESVFDERKLLQLSDHWYQQDSAPCHMSRKSMTWLHDAFSDNLISQKSEFPWPACSPDLNPLDYFLWGHVKARVFEGNPKTRAELKALVLEAITTIPAQMLQRTVRNFVHRLELCSRVEGGHFECE